jgi:hypothetical protein
MAETRYERINRQARIFPAQLLEGCESALGLFAAGFFGINDCIHFARAGLTAVCVDTNADKLLQMSTIYPVGWAFYVEDAWVFAERAAAGGRKWDIVTVDCWFDDDTQRVWDSLDLWLSVTAKAALITVRLDTELDIPDGWSYGYFDRGPDVGWGVLQRG